MDFANRCLMTFLDSTFLVSRSLNTSSPVAMSVGVAETEDSPRRWRRDLAVVMGLTTVIQFALYWPSFLGEGVLLPVHILTMPGIYLPEHLENRPLPNYGRSDLVQVSEPHRWFIAAEYRAGRIPVWTPYGFCGVPLARAPIFSPFELLYVLWPSPRVLPWIQMATAIVAATGAWLFLSRILGLGSSAAITCGAAWPLTGFLTLWQGYDLSYPVVFFAWQLLATQALFKKAGTHRIVCLAIVTALTLVSGPIDMAALVLLVTGIVWLWHLAGQWLICRSPRVIAGISTATIAGWTLGFFLAAPAWLPAFDYVKSGTRISARNDGKESRPPIGWKALPLVVFPEAFGTEKDDTVFVHPSGVRLESSAGAYAGCISLLFALPWAWFDRKRRSWSFCLLFVAILGIGWQLNVPGLVSLWRLPGLKMLSPSRLVFATAWSTLALAAIGLQQFGKSITEPRSRWLHIPSLVTVGCWLSCLAGLLDWPEKLRSLLPKGHQGLSLARIQSSFQTEYLHELCWLSCVLIIWFLPFHRLVRPSRLTPIVGLLMILEPFLHCWNLHPQPDPGLYYPRLPALEFIQRSAPGRVLGVECLPPKLLESHQLRDIRGYDGVDPLTYVQLLSLSFDRQRTSAPEYARTMWYFPELRQSATEGNSFQLHPVLNMLGLRYIVCQESVGIPEPAFQGGGYKVYLNNDALPRAWVPQDVDRSTSTDDMLKSLRDWTFDPKRKAFILESSADIPASGRGTVSLLRENPQFMSLTALMEKEGLVVIGDRYDSGWQVTVDGKPAPLLCVNHVLRGVFVSMGSHTIELRYVPAAFAIGVRFFFVATSLLMAMLVWSSLTSFRSL